MFGEAEIEIEIELELLLCGGRVIGGGVVWGSMRNCKMKKRAGDGRMWRLKVKPPLMDVLRGITGCCYSCCVILSLCLVGSSLWTMC